MNFAPGLGLLFPAVLIVMEIGRRLRNRRRNLLGSITIESAIFGLFGLLLAFTFSGAVSRYDMHRLLMTQEANNIGTAYLRLDLLPAQAQPAIRQLFRDYTFAPPLLRLGRGRSFFDHHWPPKEDLGTLSDSRIFERRESRRARLRIPSLNDMIDITASRRNAFNMHPPDVVFLLLFAFSCGCAFMAGYSIHSDMRDWVYSIALAATVTLTVYATLDIEYPRQGLIRLTSLDRSLVELRDSMK